jgi:hypothetical protein
VKSRTDYIPGAYVPSCAARSASISASRRSPAAGSERVNDFDPAFGLI